MNSRDYYQTYHGHEIEHLQYIRDSIRKSKPSSSSIIYLIGDSTLDNKFWFNDTAPAVNGYQSILNPPISKQDIEYWLNAETEKRGLSDYYTALNCAVEESTIESRTFGLLQQDKFVRDNCKENDIIVASMGGNDIALRPSLCTILNAAALVCCTSRNCLEKCTCGTSLPCEDFFCGCTTACLSNLLAWPLGYGYFLHLFGTRLNRVLQRILDNRAKPPRKILVCMLYYLDEKPGGSWAEGPLRALGYNRDPGHLQALIKSVFRDATQRIHIPGCEVIAVPLFKALNGKDTNDYCARVEPSAVGGEKMARLLMDAIIGSDEIKGATASEEITLNNR